MKKIPRLIFLFLFLIILFSNIKIMILVLILVVAIFNTFLNGLFDLDLNLKFKIPRFLEYIDSGIQYGFHNTILKYITKNIDFGFNFGFRIGGFGIK